MRIALRALLFLLVLVPLGVQAQALLANSEYYDSFQTLAQIVIMQAVGSTANRAYMEKDGHILPKNQVSLPIIIIARGREPESGAEFRFPADPRTYWTFSKNIATRDELKDDTLASSEPTPPLTAPQPTLVVPEKVIPTPKPKPTPTVDAPPLTSKKLSRTTTAIQWHKVDGQWKWQPLDPHQFKGWDPGARAPDGTRGP
jgi:hypothetical protein